MKTLIYRHVYNNYILYQESSKMTRKHLPKPLAATSVATKMGALPLRKSVKNYTFKNLA